MDRTTEAEDDIRQLLAMTWRTWGNEPLDADSIIRTWSLDLGWLAPHDAEALLAKLLEKQWLLSVDDKLTTNVELSGVNVPLGWFPRQRLIEEPPNCPRKSDGFDSSKAIITSDDDHKTKDAVDEEPEIEVPQKTSNISETKSIVGTTKPNYYDVPALLQLVSKESKLARQEVMRRAQRKRKSLGAITVWMALILVARELGVDIKNLISEDE